MAWFGFFVLYSESLLLSFRISGISPANVRAPEGVSLHAGDLPRDGSAEKARVAQAA